MQLVWVLDHKALKRYIKCPSTSCKLEKEVQASGRYAKHSKKRLKNKKLNFLISPQETRLG